MLAALLAAGRGQPRGPYQTAQELVACGSVGMDPRPRGLLSHRLLSHPWR